MPNPTIASLLYPGCTARIIGHMELCTSLTRPRPVDTSRYPGYDQHVQSDITAHCQRIKALGVDVIMPNTYALGSWENLALLRYLPEIHAAGLGLIINIDKGAYADAKSPILALQTYMIWLRMFAMSFPNYEKWQGKYIITFFVQPSDDPAMFRTIEAENPDCIFVYNDQSKGPNNMWWITPGLEITLSDWCSTHSTKPGLQIPGVSPGFDDTLIVQGKAQSVWASSAGQPTAARVWPVGIGPNMTTLAKMFAKINSYYSITNQPAYIQLVTLNDWDEKTAMEPHADGTLGFFSVPIPPAVVTHGEVWIDGAKVGDYQPGPHKVTTQQAMSDGSIRNVVTSTFTV